MLNFGNKWCSLLIYVDFCVGGTMCSQMHWLLCSDTLTYSHIYTTVIISLVDKQMYIITYLFFNYILCVYVADISTLHMLYACCKLCHHCWNFGVTYICLGSTFMTSLNLWCYPYILGMPRYDSSLNLKGYHICWGSTFMTTSLNLHDIIAEPMGLAIYLPFLSLNLWDCPYLLEISLMTLSLNLWDCPYLLRNPCITPWLNLRGYSYMCEMPLYDSSLNLKGYPYMLGIPFMT